MNTETEKTFTLRPKNYLCHAIDGISKCRYVNYVDIISLKDCLTSLNKIGVSALRKDAKSIEEILVELEHLGIIHEKEL